LWKEFNIPQPAVTKLSHAYLSDLSTKSHLCADHNSTNDEVGWWKEEHFSAADMDGDGFLNLTEFNEYIFFSDYLFLNPLFFTQHLSVSLSASSFLHPADTANPKLIHWLCKEEVRYKLSLQTSPLHVCIQIHCFA